MRTLGAFLVLLGISASLSAQDQPQPSGKFYGPLANPVPKPADGGLNSLNGFSWPIKPLPGGQKKLAEPIRVIAPNPSKCAVPLLEMKIPSDANFTMGTITPPAAANEDKAQAKSLLPPCSQP